MKKPITKEKKLSLNKLQLMKVNNMRTINGGGGGLAFFADDEVEPTPPIVKDPPIRK